MKIEDLRNACVLRAFKEVCGLPDEQIYDICRGFGFTERKGMYVHKWICAAAALNIQLEDVYVPPVYTRTLGNSYGPITSTTGMTVNQFCRNNQEGVFLVRVRSHVHVVRDGKIIDPGFKRRCARKLVLGVHRVLNPKEIEKKRPGQNPKIRFVRQGCTKGQRAVRWHRALTRTSQLTKSYWNPISFREVEEVGFTRELLTLGIRRGDIEVLEEEA